MRLEITESRITVDYKGFKPLATEINATEQLQWKSLQGDEKKGTQKQSKK